MKEKEQNDFLPEEAAPRKKKRKSPWRVILIVLLCLLLMLGMVVGGGYWWIHHTVDSNIGTSDNYTEDEVDANKKDDIVDNIVDANPDVDPDEVGDKIANVHNIALFGVDQAAGSVGRSDAMIILSIDKANNKIKMTSLARDSLVPIDGHGEEKLTHAWAYGHARLALKTINQAYGMNITDYVYINFAEFQTLIDYIGGVEVHVNELELGVLNYTTDKSQKLPGTGKQRLNSRQALLYSRIRKDSDTNRTARQREVLIAIYEQVRSQPITKLPETLKVALRLCHTNMSSNTIMDIARWAIFNTPTIESLSLPNAELKPWSGILDKARGWVRIYDLDAAKKVLYRFLYEVDTKVTGVTAYVPAPTEPESTTTTSPDTDPPTTTVAPGEATTTP